MIKCNKGRRRGIKAQIFAGKTALNPVLVLPGKFNGSLCCLINYYYFDGCTYLHWHLRWQFCSTRTIPLSVFHNAKDLRGFFNLLLNKGPFFPGLPTTSSGLWRAFGFCESLLLNGYSACHFIPIRSWMFRTSKWSFPIMVSTCSGCVSWCVTYHLALRRPPGVPICNGRGQCPRHNWGHSGVVSQTTWKVFTHHRCKPQYNGMRASSRARAEIHRAHNMHKDPDNVEGTLRRKDPKPDSRFKDHLYPF